MLFLYHCGSTTPVTKHLLHHSAHVYTRTTAHKSEWESFLFFINPPTPYHQNITTEVQGQRRTKRTKVPLAACGDITGTNPGSSPSVPGINPVLFPRGPGAGPIAAGRATTSHWRSTRRSVDPCAAWRGHHRPRMLGSLLAPTTGWPLASEPRQSLASLQCRPAGRAAASPRPLI